MRLFVTILVTIVPGVYLQEGYYWREYRGTIPSDAFAAGTNLKGENIYIGQVFETHTTGGLVPVQINEGSRNVYAEMDGARLHKKNIKILCGNQELFSWVPSSHATIKEDLKGKDLVIGGHENNWGNYLIGRVKIGGEDRIGKLLAVGWANQPGFHFINKENKNQSVKKDYEFLVYEESDVGINPRIKV